jgi:transposase InsO family protein
MSSQILNRLQARWAMFLSDFDFQLIWAPGKANVADAPSWRVNYLPKKGDETLLGQNRIVLTSEHTGSLTLPENTQFSPSAITNAMTTLSIDNSALFERFKTAFREDMEWHEALIHGNSDFTSENGIVFHKGKLFVPLPLRTDVLSSHHDAVIAGHPGRNRTFGLVARDYSWPGMQTYVQHYVEACDTCARIKTPCHKPYGLLQPLDIPARPWKSISMDFIVKLPTSHNYNSIWVVCDQLTRYSHFIPCQETLTAPDLAWLFLDQIFRLHGLPDSIISDRGSVFISKFWSELTSLLKIDTCTSTAYHPQTNGLTERTNQTLETYLCAYCSYQQDDWVDYLPLTEFAFNNLENSSTRQTPFFANYAFHPTFEPQITERSTIPAATDLAACLDAIHAELHAKLQFAQDVQTKYYNKKVLPAPKFRPGQLVWLLRRNIKTTRPSLKLDHRRLGPYPIIHKIGPSAYLLRLPSYLSRLHPVFNVSLLEPYSDPSDFHTHAPPLPFTLAIDPANDIKTILNCCKIGHHYEYLIRWKSLPESEDSWLPLSNIPTSFNELIERFHRRHPHSPCPHSLDINKNYNDSSITDYSSTSSPIQVLMPVKPSASSSMPPMPALAAVPPAAARSLSPVAVRQRLRSEYVPPTQTTTRGGHILCPAERLDL